MACWRWRLLMVLVLASPARAQSAPDGGSTVADAGSSDAAEPPAYSTKVLGRAPADLDDVGGSTHHIAERELRAMNDSDPERVAASVPGVYVRSEDGYGLRPNIGMRGVNSNRSARVTLLEDGVLLAYAPYSSPAVYSLLPMARVIGVDVLRGPSALRFGPHTIGGAIDFRTRDVPDRTRASLDYRVGSDPSSQLHYYAGSGDRRGGFLIEGTQVASAGFQHIDYSSGSNGFELGDLAVRGTWRGLGAAVRHRLSSKLVLQTERSNTSFLGLTDADFAADPYRRYVAAALDEFHRWRTQLELSDQIRFGAATTLTAVAYRSDVHRVAYRFVRFRNGPSITSVLANPDALPILPYFHLLNGAADNSDSERTLLYEHNDYRYVSQGVQADARWQRRGGAYRHEVRSGARAHYDSIERAISTDAFRMLSRRLVADRARVLVGDDRAETMALSAYAQYALGWRKVTLAPGARVEALTMRFDDRDDDRRVDGSLVELMPGASLLYDPTAAVRAFAGVYRGFTPPSPAGIATTSAETSINYELGARLDAARATRVELTGFVSDHDHIRSECIDGCNDLDEAFNAGRVIIGGVEAAAQRRFRLGGYELPVEASYAFTASSFRTAFVSTDPQLGAVEVGDELPYVPAHQASLGLGLERRGRFALRVRGLYIAPMREEASQGDQGRRTDAQWLLDAAGSLRVTPRVTLLLRGDNLLDRAPIVARRPYGARTTRPLQLEVGLRLDL